MWRCGGGTALVMMGSQIPHVWFDCGVSPRHTAGAPDVMDAISAAWVVL